MHLYLALVSLLLGVVVFDERLLLLGHERMVAGLVAHEDGPKEKPANDERGLNRQCDQIGRIIAL